MTRFVFGHLGHAGSYVIFAACAIAFLTAAWIGSAHVPQQLLQHNVFEHHDFADNSLDAVMNETLGFQKIFVINMASQTDRRDGLSLAAALRGIKMDFIDGVTEFDQKASPVRQEDRQWREYNNKTWFSWRAHVNAIRTVVEQNLTTALIMEDDADYDVRIKTQMRDFARATRLLLQPQQGTDTSLDPTNPRKSMDDKPHDIDLEDPRIVTEPTTSPYGDIDLWDVLWLGHCGVSPAEPSFPEHALARVIKQNDPTAIQPQHYQPLPNSDKKVWPRYPNNTRMVFHAHTPGCNLAYAINNQSARKLLYQLGIKNMTGFSDITLHKICNGDHILNSEYKYKRRRCLSVLPTLFGHHFPQAYPRAFTENVRCGTRANFEKLIDGDTDYYDAFPDDEPMSLYFHHLAAKGRYETFLKDPDRIRKKVEDERGIVRVQRELDEKEARGGLA